MLQLVLFTALLGAEVVSAIAFTAPAVTHVKNHQWPSNGWTPKPTAAQHYGFAFYTPSHDLRRQEVVANDPNICGYVNGNADLPYSCPNNFTCAGYAPLSVFGCCSGTSGQSSFADCPAISAQPSSCYDYTDRGLCTGDCLTGTAPALVCDDPSLGSCGVATLIGVLGSSTETFSQISCFSQRVILNLSPIAITTTAVQTPTPTQTDPAFFNPTLTSSSSSTSSPSSSPGKSHTGAIAGGVVGGVVVLGLILAAIIYVLRERKKSQREEAIYEIQATPITDKNFSTAVHAVDNSRYSMGS